VLVEALRLIGRLQEENRTLAGQMGYLQAQLEQARETIRALEAPRTTQETPHAAQDANLSEEGQNTAPELSAPPRSWWAALAFWRT
jgi:hypothetical protein